MILLLIVSCAGPRQTVSLPPFPEVGVEYEYLIKLPVSATQATVMWYYGAETRAHMIYSSGLVNLKTTTIRTEMYFPRPGKYILVVLTQTAYGIHKDRMVYHTTTQL